MSVRRPPHIRHSSRIADCIEALETSSDATTQDNILASWAKLIHIAEDIGDAFALDNLDRTIRLSDDLVHADIRKYRAQLQDWRDNAGLATINRQSLITSTECL